jgi:hypothetical protein
LQERRNRRDAMINGILNFITLSNSIQYFVVFNFEN